MGFQSALFASRACVIALSMASLAFASTPCEESLRDCKEDCSIEFGGSTQLAMKKKFDGCLAKCTKTNGLCTERALETERNNLDVGALEQAPGSREVDSDGFSTGTRASKTKASSSAKSDDAAPATRDSESKSAPKVLRPAPELTADEIPKSQRSEIKADPKEEARIKEAADAEKAAAAERAKAAEAAKPSSAEPKATSASARKNVEDKDLRDPVETPKVERKNNDESAATFERKTATKKADRKKESDDDLRNF
jgi:hypothetical protein